MRSDLEISTRIHTIGVKIPRINLVDLLCFLIPLIQFLQLQSVGRIFLSEIVIFLLAPFLVLRAGRRLAEPRTRTVLFLAIAWLVAQIVTDIYRGSEFQDYARGWSRVAFTVVDFGVLSLLISNKRRRVILFFIGLAIGSLLTYVLNPGEFSESEPWKFGYGPGVTWLIVLLALFVSGRRMILPLTILLFAGALNIYLGSRANGGGLFLSAIYFLYQWRFRSRGGVQIRLNVIRAAWLVAAGGMVVLAGIYGYGAAARSGLLGEKASIKYESQALGAYGLLIGGRSEVLVSTQAIIDSPWLGHGSWAKDCRYASALTIMREELGYSQGGEREDCRIPTHSFLFGSWVEAGIVGAMFWMYVIALTWRLLTVLYQTNETVSIVATVIAFSLLWDILFSPYGAQQRFIAMYYVVAVIFLLDIYVPRRKGVSRLREV